MASRRALVKGLSAAAWAGALLLVQVPAGGQTQGAGKWKPLADDALHDPTSPALGVLQEPTEALSLLPPDNAGNRVDWIRALREGYIQPRTKVFEETQINVLDSDVLMQRTGEMPMVLFPHRAHTEWLDCSNCHEALFKLKAGATRINMFAILQGEQCGQCHGAVAFPLTECRRCHSVPRTNVIR